MKNCCEAGSCKKEFCKKACKIESAAPEAEKCCAPKKETKAPKSSCGCK